jgi:hypothetical protein
MKITPYSLFRDFLLFLGCCAIGAFMGFAVLVVLVSDFFSPDPAYRHVRTGEASWYWGSGMVCASRQYPRGSWVRVTYGRASIVVQVTSRGPAWRFFKRGRIIDLSRTAFVWLAPQKIGLIAVTVEACDPPKPAPI